MKKRPTVPNTANTTNTNEEAEKTTTTTVATATTSNQSSQEISANTSTKIISTASNNNNNNNSISNTTFIMKEQLLYLAKIMGFEVSFNDYPKGGSHNDVLTIVTLSTEPPQICHGSGGTSEESQNDAARNALKILSELGLNSAKK